MFCLRAQLTIKALSLLLLLLTFRQMSSSHSGGGRGDIGGRTRVVRIVQIIIILRAVEVMLKVLRWVLGET